MGQSLSDEQKTKVSSHTRHSSHKKEMQKMLKDFDISNSTSANCTSFFAFCSESVEKVENPKTMFHVFMYIDKLESVSQK